MNISLIVLACVLALGAARKLGRLRVKIWQVMVGGALVVLITGEISPAEAVAAADLDVMLFLFGMFVLGKALVRSGDLYALAYRVLPAVGSAGRSGAGRAIRRGDSLRAPDQRHPGGSGHPLVLQLAREHRIDPQVLLLTSAFGVTTGSVMSPIGNPQNLLIAVRTGMESPFPASSGRWGRRRWRTC